MVRVRRHYTVQGQNNEPHHQLPFKPDPALPASSLLNVRIHRRCRLRGVRRLRPGDSATSIRKRVPVGDRARTYQRFHDDAASAGDAGASAAIVLQPCEHIQSTLLTLNMGAWRWATFQARRMRRRGRARCNRRSHSRSYAQCCGSANWDVFALSSIGDNPDGRRAAIDASASAMIVSSAVRAGWSRPACKTAVVDAGAPAVIVTAMRDCQGCLALRSIASISMGGLAVTSAGASGAIVAAVRRHVPDVHIAHTECTALGNIAMIGNGKLAAIDAGAPAAIVTAKCALGVVTHSALRHEYRSCSYR